MKKHNFIFSRALLLLAILPVFISCSKKTNFSEDFNNIHDRTWISEEFWAVPMEDWAVKDGRVECVGNRSNMRVNLISHMLENGETLSVSVKMGLLNADAKKGNAGFRIGIQDKTDNTYKSICYFGDGINLGIDIKGRIFIDNTREVLPEDFGIDDFSLSLSVKKSDEKFALFLMATDKKNRSAIVTVDNVEDISGMFALVNNFEKKGAYSKGAKFWFDDLSISGGSLVETPEQNYGPVLFTMYTLSKGVMKMTAQLPPLGEKDNQYVDLQLKKDGKWETETSKKIEKDARIAVFKVENWDDTKDVEYRVVYQQRYTDGGAKDCFYPGTIRRDPVDQPLTMGGLTCQYHYGFPYAPLTSNLKKQNPDILYFSGDQIYEGNGGYGIIRFPADMAILNYLGKWYMFGWAFGDIMKDRPTICIPDDHEVFQGNLWGNGGKSVSVEKWKMNADCLSGFVEPKEMVQVVMHTNSAHLPDPYDPTPMEQGIDVYYTDVVYGRVSFAIVGDRIFKTGPENVSSWDGRKDHIKKPLKDLSVLEDPSYKLLGDRQMKFLKHWTKDWKGADMKCLLSQTVFANAATHHGGDKMFLYGDMDSGGWPKTGRDKVVDLIRKSYSFQICGDQHLPSISQYGIDEFRDGSWVFCTPAICVGYQRRFFPDRLGWPVSNRPEHGLPNTGNYTDAFGNKNYIYAVGNPDDETEVPNRYMKAQKCSSGYGVIKFDKDNRTIESNAYRFLADLDKEFPSPQFPGWPKTVSQFDNFGKEAKAYLPEIKVDGVVNPVIEVDDSKGELQYIVRIKGNKFSPKVFKSGTYSIKVGDPDQNKWKTIDGVKSINKEASEEIKVKL